jgi:hypothetical protein
METADVSKEDLEKGVFELTINKDKTINNVQVNEDTVVFSNQGETIPFSPIPRRNAYLQLHKGYLYLYGGCFEAKNGKEYTLTDLYCLNTKKVDEWKTLLEDKAFKTNDVNALKKIEELGKKKL